MVASFATGPCGPAESLFAAERDAGLLAASPPVFITGTNTGWHNWIDVALYPQLFLWGLFGLRCMRHHLAVLNLGQHDHVIRAPQYQQGMIALQHYFGDPDSLESAALILAWAMQPCSYLGKNQCVENHMARVHQILRLAIPIYFSDDEWKILSNWVRTSGHLQSLILSALRV